MPNQNGVGLQEADAAAWSSKPLNAMKKNTM